MSNKCSGETKTQTAGSCGCGGGKERVCSDGVRYVQKHSTVPPKAAVMACEGGCLKGEVARVAANILAYRLERSSAVRICLGDAATGNSGFLDLVTRTPQVIAVEGCPMQCGTEIMRYRVPGLQTTAVIASELYDFDREEYFEVFDMPREEIEKHAQKVADHIQRQYFTKAGSAGACNCSCSRE